MVTGAAARGPSPGRRERQRLETARSIKEAALELFVARGFDAATTKDIAERAGVAHGTVFLVAKSKEGLLVAALEDQLREVLTARTASLPKRGVEAQLLHVFDGLFDFYARDRRLAREFFRAVIFFSDPVTKAQNDAHVAGFLGYLAELFERGKARGEVAPGVPCDAAATIVLALYSHCVTWFLNAEHPDRRALGARFRGALEAVFAGLRAPLGDRPAADQPGARTRVARTIPALTTTSPTKSRTKSRSPSKSAPAATPKRGVRK